MTYWEGEEERQNPMNKLFLDKIQAEIHLEKPPLSQGPEKSMQMDNRHIHRP